VKCQVPAGATVLPRAQCAPHEFHVGDLVLRRVQGSKIGTSYRHLGRDRSPSTRCIDQGHTRSSTRTGGPSPTHGTSNTCAHFILSKCSNLVHQ
jgi:hypothetical protein